MRHTSFAAAVLVLFASLGGSQTPATSQGRDIPDFSVQVWGDIVADFRERVLNYVELRSRLEIGLPALTVTNDAGEIKTAVRSLGKRVRVAREGAKQGEIFTPTIATAFRKVLMVETKSPTMAAIMDENPGEFSHGINSPYPMRKPLSTVPPNLLALLPTLPDDVQYRFVGRHLILHDTRANVIVDRIYCALQCRDHE